MIDGEQSLFCSTFGAEKSREEHNRSERSRACERDMLNRESQKVVHGSYVTQTFTLAGLLGLRSSTRILEQNRLTVSQSNQVSESVIKCTQF